MKRHRILFLTCHLPYPPVSGGRRREFELLKRIGREVDVHLAVISKTYDEDVANAPVLDDLCREISIFRALPEPNVEGDTAPSEPYQLLRHRSVEGSRRIPQIIASELFDVIHVEAFYVMQHVPDDCDVPIFLQEQNVEYDLWRQRASTVRTKNERRVALAQYLRTLESEIAAWKRSDICGAITAEDRHTMRRALADLDVRLIPDGADHLVRERGNREARHNPTQTPIVAFIANFAYQPNCDAALHLCRDIWPTIRSRVPAARLLLVGNSPPPEVVEFARRDRRIAVTGRVESVHPFLEAADVIACPLRIGGGIKVKVLEALCHGKALVTTTVGTQGLSREVAGAAIVEDNPHRFALSVVSLLNRPKERRRLEAAATAFSLTLPTWDAAASALLGVYDELAARRSRSGDSFDGSLQEARP